LRLAVWPIALGAAAIDYRALGHTISGDYVVVRSGLTNRATTALQRSAVGTIAVASPSCNADWVCEPRPS